MKREQRKLLARTLYVDTGMTQAQVVDFSGASKSTVERWCKDGNWRQLRQAHGMTRTQALTRIYQQIDDLSSVIAKRPSGERFATSKEADILTKLTNAIEKLEGDTPLRIVLDVFSTALQWFAKVNIVKAKQFVELSNEYIEAHPESNEFS